MLIFQRLHDHCVEILLVKGHFFVSEVIFYRLKAPEVIVRILLNFQADHCLVLLESQMKPVVCVLEPGGPLFLLGGEPRRLEELEFECLDCYLLVFLLTLLAAEILELCDLRVYFIGVVDVGEVVFISEPLGEFGRVDIGEVRARDHSDCTLHFGQIAVVVFNALVDELCESGVTLMRTGILRSRKSRMVRRSLIQSWSCCLSRVMTPSLMQQSSMDLKSKFLFSGLAMLYNKVGNYYLILLHSSKSMEDRSISQPYLEPALSKETSYLQSILQLNSHALEQRTLLAFDANTDFNEIKQIIYSINQATKNISVVLEGMGLKVINNIVTKVVSSSYLISLHLLKVHEGYQKKRESKIIEQRRLSKGILDDSVKQLNDKTQRKTTFSKDKQSKEEIQANQSTLHEKKKPKFLNRLGGISLYQESYNRRLEKDVIRSEKKSMEENKKQKQVEKTINYKEFKRKIFQNLDKELKAAEEEIYQPVDDEITSFLVHEKKFLESFNHQSRAEDMEQLVDFFNKSTLEAADFLKKTNMSEEVSKFKAEVHVLLKDLKLSKEEREKNIELRFMTMLGRFKDKRQSENVILLNKLKSLQVQKCKREQQKVSVCTETNTRELKSIKIYQSKIQQLQHRLTYFQVEKEKKMQELLEKIDSRTNQIKRKDFQVATSLIKKDEEIKTLKMELEKLKENNRRKTNYQNNSKQYNEKQSNQQRNDDEGSTDKKKRGSSRSRKSSTVASGQKERNRKELSRFNQGEPESELSKKDDATDRNSSEQEQCENESGDKCDDGKSEMTIQMPSKFQISGKSLKRIDSSFIDENNKFGIMSRKRIGTEKTINLRREMSQKSENGIPHQSFPTSKKTLNNDVQKTGPNIHLKRNQSNPLSNEGQEKQKKITFNENIVKSQADFEETSLKNGMQTNEKGDFQRKKKIQSIQQKILEANRENRRLQIECRDRAKQQDGEKLKINSNMYQICISSHQHYNSKIGTKESKKNSFEGQALSGDYASILKGQRQNLSSLGDEYVQNTLDEKQLLKNRKQKLEEMQQIVDKIKNGDQLTAEQKRRVLSLGNLKRLEKMKNHSPKKIEEMQDYLNRYHSAEKGRPDVSYSVSQRKSINVQRLPAVLQVKSFAHHEDPNGVKRRAQSLATGVGQQNPIRKQEIADYLTKILSKRRQKQASFQDLIAKGYIKSNTPTSLIKNVDGEAHSDLVGKLFKKKIGKGLFSNNKGSEICLPTLSGKSYEIRRG